MIRYFFVANFINNGISDYLNLIKFIAEPKNFSFVHITLKGPFVTKQKTQLKKIKRELEHKEIKITEIGNFFEYHQNTVFFKFERDEELYEIWKSKTDRTYKTYNPHITIYDGADSDFSKDLYNLFKDIEIHTKLKIEEIDMYSKLRKNEIFHFDDINFNLLKYLDKDLNLNNRQDILNYFQNLEYKKKLNYIKIISEKLIKELDLEKH